MHDKQMLLFAGTSHPELALEVANYLGVQLGRLKFETFPDNEIGVRVLENVRDRDVFVLQSVAQHPNLYLMEMLILIDALKRASARSIGAVIPYFGYARQDRRGGEGAPITAKLVADMLEKAGATRVITMDLHAEQIQGFFNIPVDNLYAEPLLVEAVKALGWQDLIVIAPDVGSIKLARSFAESLKVDFGVIDKRRFNAKQVEADALVGSVADKKVLLVDDMCSTGWTLKIAADVCRKAGAKEICAAVTHGLLNGPGFEESAIKKMWISNTVPLQDKVNSNRLQVVSVAALFGQAMRAL